MALPGKQKPTASTSPTKNEGEFKLPTEEELRLLARKNTSHITQPTKANPKPTATNEDDEETAHPGAVGTTFKRHEIAPAIAARLKVYEVMTLLETGDIDEDTLRNLILCVDNHRPFSMDDAFNIKEELQTQMQIVRSVRSTILSPSGQLNKNTTVSEVKAVMDSSMRLTTAIQAAQKEITNMERIQAVEAAFLEVIAEFPEEQQKLYVQRLEHRMKLQKELAEKRD